MKETNLPRCGWQLKDPLMILYHDSEWGVPIHDERKLFEYMVLDAFQAGLNWAIVLNKRENFRKALDNFKAEKIAVYGPEKLATLLSDPGIIRNRAKINGTLANAKAFLKVQQEFGSFDKYIWSFVGHKTAHNSWKNLSELPAKTKVSDIMSRDLIKRGFKFAGSKICYAFMQAAGLVNDHTVDCFRYEEIKRLSQ